jgi:hypothetical protein
MKALFYFLISTSLMVNVWAETPKKNTPKKVAVPNRKTSKYIPKAQNTSMSKSLSPEKAKLAKSAIVIIKGSMGDGTGFMANFKGKKVVITNTHVIKDNKNFKFYTRSGREIKIKNLFFSKDRDISILETEDQQITPLQICDNVGELKNSTPVVVYGNSQGESVITEVKGTLQGTGPTEIESDAKFVEGNSGSPIIETPTGKVIGVATRATCRYSWTTYNTKFEVRRFGTRIDNITWDDFQKYDRKKYAYDAYLMRKIESSVITACLFLKKFHECYGEKPDEFGPKKVIREKIKYLHCKLDRAFYEVPELREVYKRWNLKYKDNIDRLKSAEISRQRRASDPYFSNSEYKTDLHFLIDFRTNYLCLKYTVPRLISAGRKQYKKKPFYYEFFKKEGKKYLDAEKELLDAYNEMITNLTMIYNTK